MAQYFVNEKTGREFQVLDFDTATKKIKLKGDLGEFTEEYNKARWKELGYTLVNRPDPETEEAEEAEADE